MSCKRVKEVERRPKELSDLLVVGNSPCLPVCNVSQQYVYGR